MISLQRPWPRRALCITVFFVTGAVGLLATGWVLYRFEILLNLWLSGISFLNNIGLFSSLDGESWEDAVFESLVCVWVPFSAWLAWCLNRFLKGRTNGLTGVKP